MTEKIIPPAVYIQDTGTKKGRGVFTARDFKEGELVERAPVLILYRPFESLPPRLQRFVFNWGYLAKSRQKCTATVFGYGSMYHHNNPANMRYRPNVEMKAMDYTAACDISAGEELTVNYNAASGEPVSEKDNWFEMMGITPLVD